MVWHVGCDHGQVPRVCNHHLMTPVLEYLAHPSRMRSYLRARDLLVRARYQHPVTTEISASTIIHTQCGWEVGRPHRLGEWSMILKARQLAAAIVT
jgi:hypothetical protein